MQKIRKKRLVYFIFCAMFWFTKYRNVVQPGRTLRSGRRSRRFESSHSDQPHGGSDQFSSCRRCKKYFKSQVVWLFFLFKSRARIWSSEIGGSTTSSRRAEERRWAKRVSACATQMKYGTDYPTSKLSCRKRKPNLSNWILINFSTFKIL